MSHSKLTEDRATKTALNRPVTMHGERRAVNGSLTHKNSQKLLGSALENG